MLPGCRRDALNCIPFCSLRRAGWVFLQEGPVKLRGGGGCAFVVWWNTVGRSRVQGFAAQGGRGRHLRASPVADLDFVCRNAAKTNKRFFCALRRTQRSGNCKAGVQGGVCLSAGPGLWGGWYGGLCNFQGLSLWLTLCRVLFLALPLVRCSLGTVDYWHARSLWGGALDVIFR